jgi:hypothetical protein
VARVLWHEVRVAGLDPYALAGRTVEAVVGQDALRDEESGARMTVSVPDLTVTSRRR